MGPDVARRLRHHVPLLHQRTHLTHPPAAARAAAAAAGGEAWFEADLRGRRVADVQAAYRRDGVVCLRRAFDASWIESLREIVPAALAPDNADLEQYSDGFSGEMDCGRKYPEVQDFVFSSPCAELAARVIGSASLNFFYDFLFVKEPGAAARTPWHQASPGPLPPLSVISQPRLTGSLCVWVRTSRTGMWKARTSSPSGCPSTLSRALPASNSFAARISMATSTRRSKSEMGRGTRGRWACLRSRRWRRCAPAPSMTVCFPRICSLGSLLLC